MRLAAAFFPVGYSAPALEVDEAQFAESAAPVVRGQAFWVLVKEVFLVVVVSLAEVEFFVLVGEVSSLVVEAFSEAG